MTGKVIFFPMAAEVQPIPIRQMEERTGKHRCVLCGREVETEEYFRNDTCCDGCASAEDLPSVFSGGHPSGFSPVDDLDVREEIRRRGMVRA